MIQSLLNQLPQSVDVQRLTSSQRTRCTGASCDDPLDQFRNSRRRKIRLL